MSKKLIVTLILVIVLVAAGLITGYYLYSNYQENVIKPEKIMLGSGDNYNLFSLNNKSMILIEHETPNNKTDLYFTEISDRKSISINDSKKLCILSGRGYNIFVKVIKNDAFVIVSFPDNVSTAVIDADDNMHIKQIYWISNIEISSFIYDSSRYYLFGQDLNITKLIVSSDLRHFKEIFSLKNVKFLLSDYFVHTSNGRLYLAYNLEFRLNSMSNYRSALLEVNKSSVREIFNTTANIWRIFAYSFDNEIYFYLFSNKTTLMIFNASTDHLLSKVKGMNVFVYYHDSKTNITIGAYKYFMYSKNGIHFKNLYPRGDLVFDTTNKNLVLIKNDHLYILAMNGNCQEILKFDLSQIQG